MTNAILTEAKLKANKKNALKSTGPKTPEGKAVVKHNALKHGLLAKEVVITIGEGAEDQHEFEDLLSDLNTQLKPEGTLEGMLVEKIAACWWRLRRAYKCEVGLIREQLDMAEEDYYEDETWDKKRKHRTEEVIYEEIRERKGWSIGWRKDKKSLLRMTKENRPLDEIMNWDVNWGWLRDKEEVAELLSNAGIDPDSKALSAIQLREFLTKQAGWDEKAIWRAHIELCAERVTSYKEEIEDLEKEIRKNRFKVQIKKLLGNVPDKEELDRLLR